MMEFYQGALLPASLETLGQARRLATMLGLSVYALLPLPSQLDHGDDDLTVTCGRHGADKVVMLTGDGLSRESEMRFSSYAGALLNACALLPPRVFMLADSPAARDIAPRLSARLGAAYIARGAIVTDGEQLLFSDASGRRLQVAMEDPSEDGLAAVPTPVVLTVPPGRFAMARGGAEAEMLLIASPEGDASSDQTPVAAVGFVEEELRSLPAWARISVEQGQPSVDSLPRAPLFHLQGAPQPADVRVCSCQVAIGPDALSQPVHYALVVDESAVAATQIALQQYLQSPALSRSTESTGSRRRVEASGLTPTGERDGWGGKDGSATGDSDPTDKIAQLLGGARHPDAYAPLRSDSTPPIARQSAPVLIGGFDSDMWAGWTTPGDEGGAPEFEMEMADTAPVSVAPMSGPISIAVKPALVVQPSRIAPVTTAPSSTGAASDAAKTSTERAPQTQSQISLGFDVEEP